MQQMRDTSDLGIGLVRQRFDPIQVPPHFFGELAGEPLDQLQLQADSRESLAGAGVQLAPQAGPLPLHQLGK
jgi:hypothetical protein